MVVKVFKRVVVSLVALTVGMSLTGGLALGQTTTGFQDVPSGHVAETAIRWAAANSITTGVGNNRFGMGQTLTRYQMVTFLCRAFDPGSCSSGAGGSDKFVDVPAGHWANPSIGWAVDEGITSGTSPTTFGGAATLTREQMVTFLHRAKGSPTGGPLGSDTYNDAPADRSHWANTAVGWAYEQGISAGISGGVFGYGTSLSRQEVVLFLCRAVAPDVCAPSHNPLPSGVTVTTRVTTTTTTTPSGEATACDFPDHAARVSEGVYQVHAGQGIGTAFYIGNDEWLTAAHVVGSLTSVTLRRAEVSLNASVVGSNADADLALLRATAGNVPALQFGKVSDIGPGHPVYSVGFPVYVASQPSITSGVLSRVEAHAELGSLLVTDAAVSPGNSGGPIVNRCGQVLGLVVSKIVGEGVEGISYAVAEVTMRSLLAELRTGGTSTPPPSGSGTSSLPSNVGDWVRFSGETIDGKYEGYRLSAIEHSGYTWESPPTLYIRCGISNPTWDNIYLATDWLILSDVDDDGEVIVVFRFSHMDDPVGEWWWSDEDLESAVFADGTDTEFVLRLREATTGYLWMRIWDGFTDDSHSMRFEIDGAATVLSDLKCW